MGSLANDVISLADLPSDIMLLIARMRLDFIDDMRVISHRWNNATISLLNDLNDREQLPTISRFVCENVARFDANFIVTISKCKKKFFRIENLSCYSESSEFGTYGKKFYISEREPLRNGLSMLFARCSVVEKIEICDYTFERMLDIKDSLRNMRINEIVIRGVSFDTWLMRNLRGLVVTHSIKKLKFTTRRSNSTSWDAARQDLIELLNTCATLQTTVEFVFLYSPDERRTNTSMQDIWQARIDDLNRSGNFTANIKTANTYFYNVSVTIHVKPKLPE